MSTIDDVRSLLQDVISPSFRALEVQVDALDKQVDGLDRTIDFTAKPLNDKIDSLRRV